MKEGAFEFRTNDVYWNKLLMVRDILTWFLGQD
jgi:hypothetical protein